MRGWRGGDERAARGEGGEGLSCCFSGDNRTTARAAHKFKIPANKFSRLPSFLSLPQFFRSFLSRRVV
jgi:hypothetical protein